MSTATVHLGRAHNPPSRSSDNKRLQQGGARGEGLGRDRESPVIVAAHVTWCCRRGDVPYALSTDHPGYDVRHPISTATWPVPAAKKGHVCCSRNNSLSVVCHCPAPALAIDSSFSYGSGIAEQVAKPKERATVVASPLDLMPADAPKLQNRLKALADEAERLAAGKKQKMNAETAAEEGGFGFGFGFDVHASGMNGSGSWIGSGAPAAAVAPHNSRAIRRRREED